MLDKINLFKLSKDELFAAIISLGEKTFRAVHNKGTDDCAGERAASAEFDRFRLGEQPDHTEQEESDGFFHGNERRGRLCGGGWPDGDSKPPADFVIWATAGPQVRRTP